MHVPRSFLRTAAVIGVAGLTVLAAVGAATAASAHVSVHPDTTAAGAESAEVVFRVPTESASASTVTLALTLPSTTPFALVLVRPVPGWSSSIVEAKLPKPVVVDGTTFTKAPHVVTWTAAPGSGIKPNGYQDFAIEAGPLPDSGDVTFTATQTYSDGSVVHWNEIQQPGAGEPDHPAPTFAITPASAAVPPSPVSSKDNDNALAVAALAVGIVALLVGGAALVATRRRPQVIAA